MIELSWDSQDVDVWKNRRVDEAIAKAVIGAGGDAVRKLRTVSTKKVRERKKLKVKTVRAALPLIFPATSTKNALTTLQWTMKVSGKPIPIGAYPVRPTAKGVLAEINVGRKSLIKGAFLATMRSGHLGVFRRKGAQRLPIRELYTTRVSDVFKDQGFVDSRYNEARIVFQTTYARLLAANLDCIGAR